MQAILPLGNDIVDLRLADNKINNADRRFVERVLAAEERIAPSCAAIDNGVLWAYWAAKETAYKALIKTSPGLIFAHRRFIVRPETHAAFTGDNSSAQGVVCYEAQRVPVTWVCCDDWIHCLTESGSGQSRYRIRPLSEFMQSETFIAAKKDSTLSDASIVVRLLALSLLEECGIHDVQIIREPAGRRMGPPQVVQNGVTMSNVDISLSHHGRYAAAAIRIAPQ